MAGLVPLTHRPALAEHRHQRGTVRITGVLATDAVVRTGTNGGSFLELQVAGVTAHDSPLRALRSVGTGPGAQYVADRMARYLRRGTRVTLYGTGLVVEPRGLLLQGCDHVEHVPQVPPHEREGSALADALGAEAAA